MTSDEEMQLYIEMLSAQSEESARLYKESHAGDPCKRCGSKESIEIIATGSAGRWTPLCHLCIERLHAITEAYHDGFKEGREAACRRSLWGRIRNKI